MTSTPQHLAIVAVIAMPLACADISLDTIKDGGSTVPVPDMQKISFAENGLTGDVLVSGTSAAVQPSADVRVENVVTGTVDRTTATDQGAFAVLLTDADIGDTLSLTVEADGDTSDAAELGLGYDGVPPAAPLEVNAFARLEEPGTAEISGVFLGAVPTLVVRVVVPASGLVVEGETVPAEANRGFEMIISAASGSEILVNGTDPEHPGAPGRFSRTEVLPP